MRAGLVALPVSVTLLVLGCLAAPSVASAATCADHPNQAAAQRAADTRDGDGDGIYCESLPCPCLRGTARPRREPKPRRREAGCSRPRGVVDVRFARSRYPHIRVHMARAIRRGWPRVLSLHRRKSGVRRDRALDGFPSRPGFDRDEYPPAVGRATWRADIAYVPSGENRSHGASLGAQLRPYCAGTRFRYVFF